MAGNEEKLVKMLKYVSEHNDFYKNRIKEYEITNPLDITQWPILTRKELQENRYNMFSDGYKSKYYNQQLRRQFSSGSSGVPISVYWDYKDWYASNMSLWRKRWEWYGIKPNDKYVVFTLNAFNVNAECETVYYIQEPKNILSINVSLLKNENQYKIVAEMINKFQPTWLYVQPSVLNRLLNVYLKFGLRMPQTLRYIEFVGELLDSNLSRRVFLDYNIAFSNMYGSEEMNGIALKHPDKGMCILDDNVFVELGQDERISKHGKGEAIITNLNNYAMPLVRYSQGDILHVNSSFLLNNHNYAIIDEICGRVLTQSIIINGVEITQILLLELMSEVNNEFNDAIIEYSFDFHSNIGKLICYVLINPKQKKWYKSIKNAIADRFQKKANADSIETVLVDNEYGMNITSKKILLNII